MKLIGWTPLHVHGQFSFLDGLIKYEDLMPRLKELGMNSCAISEHGNCHGLVNFYKEAQKHGIKSILGMEGYLSPGSMHDKSSGKQDSFHMTLLAQTNEGYQNLIKLSSVAFLEGFYYRPRVDHETLASLSAGLVAGSGCMSGELFRSCLGSIKNTDKVMERTPEQVIDWWLGVFGEDRYFVEVMDTSVPEQKLYNEFAIWLARKKGARICITTDAHYLRREDQPAHNIFMAIGTNQKVDDPEASLQYGPDYYIKSPEEVTTSATSMGCPEAVTSTLDIANSCNVEIELKKTKMPVVEIENRRDYKEFIDWLQTNEQSCL